MISILYLELFTSNWRTTFHRYFLFYFVFFTHYFYSFLFNTIQFAVFYEFRFHPMILSTINIIFLNYYSVVELLYTFYWISLIIITRSLLSPPFTPHTCFYRHLTYHTHSSIATYPITHILPSPPLLHHICFYRHLFYHIYASIATYPTTYILLSPPILPHTCFNRPTVSAGVESVLFSVSCGPGSISATGRCVWEISESVKWICYLFSRGCGGLVVLHHCYAGLPDQRILLPNGLVCLW